MDSQIAAQAAPQGGYLLDLIQVAGALLLLLGVLFLALYLLKRYGPRAGLGVFGRGDLKLESQLALGPRRSVVVVRYLNKRMVLGVTETSINLLTEMESGHAPDSTNFADTLASEASRGPSRP